MTAKKRYNYRSECPGCGRKANNKLREDLGVNVRECLSCGAFFGEVEHKDRENVVKDHMHPDPNSVSCDNLQYFDVEVIAEDGSRKRTHGWMDALTRMAVQVG